jgi:hypothetical protein
MDCVFLCRRLKVAMPLILMFCKREVRQHTPSRILVSASTARLAGLVSFSGGLQPVIRRLPLLCQVDLTIDQSFVMLRNGKIASMTHVRGNAGIVLLRWDGAIEIEVAFQVIQVPFAAVRGVVVDVLE